GPPLDDATVLGPINNEDNAAKVDLHLAEAQAGGARMLTGGGRVPGMPMRLFYEPTVITDVPPDCALHRDETFGPVIPILPFADEAGLFALVAKSRMGLSGAVFTQDIDAAFSVATRLPCGIVNVNDASSYWETHIPAGGAAGTTSGLGRIGGRHTLIEMSDLKTLTFHIKRTGNA
ncbi:MAG: aldehyde dehydrogenase family protein, partial [Alphaproteobacteria bacterium]|nr:aldehyde dehydrogenase family protein [Alphaproteobacteria bacterium]